MRTPIFEPWGNSTLAENYDRYLDDKFDDLPPTTVITECRPAGSDRIRVRRTTADNGRVKRVTVNGLEAKATRANFAEWELELKHAGTSPFDVVAGAEDAAGNVEPRPHRVRDLNSYAGQ
jgi:hypothetical protein